MSGDALDELVRRVVVGRIARLGWVMPVVDDGAGRELADAESRLTGLAESYADCEITPAEWRAARGRLVARIEQLQATIGKAAACQGAPPKGGSPAPWGHDAVRAWEVAPLSVRVSVVRALVDAVVVGPSVRGPTDSTVDVGDRQLFAVARRVTFRFHESE